MANVIDQTTGDGWAVYNGDCVECLSGMPDESVHFTLFSPPYMGLYVYSDSPKDMGNCRSDAEFHEHFGYVIRDLLRVTKPGRIVAVDVMNVPAMKERDGFIGIKDFRGEVIRRFVEAGFIFHSEVCMWKDPLIEATRSKALGLMHKQLCKDSAMSRMGQAQYILAFRKPGENREPIYHPDGLTEFYGENPPTTGTLSHERWRRYASPVWMDIDFTRTLNYHAARDQNDERHICLARGCLVLTAEGHKPIQDVQIGDMVLTHMGRWRPVKAVAMTGVRPCVKLTAQGVPNLVLTPDHKVWTRMVGDKARHRDAATRVDPSWERADETTGSYVNMQLPPISVGPELTNQEWWIVGRWIADGHKGVRGDFHISVGRAKIDDFLLIAEPFVGARHEISAVQFRLKGLRNEMIGVLNQCGIGANGKRVPPCAIAIGKEQASHLLSGYLSGDGHMPPERHRWTATSVSRELLLGMAMVANRVHGTVASVHAGREAGQTVIQGRTVNTQQEWIMSFDTPVESRIKPFILDDGAWKKVRSVTDAGEHETWCLQVEEDESFTAEGCVVKNCPMALDAIHRCLQLWSNPGEVVLSPFAGIGSEGFESVKLGRKFVGFELKPSYFAQAVLNLTRAAREANERDLFSDIPEEIEA